jgi:ABC-2 type transport system permease protein
MRYFKLLSLFVKSSLAIDLEYRANFMGALLMSAVDLVWGVAGIAFLFAFTDNIGGWSFYEALIVIGLVYIGWGINDAFLWPNTRELGEHIRKGTMDFILTKPINSQMHATFRRFKFDRLFTAVSGLVIIGYALQQLQWSPTLGQWLSCISLFITAMLMMYSLVIMLASSAFWIVNINNLTELFFGLLETGRHPASAYPAPMRIVISFVVPVAFISTVPAEALLGRLNLWTALYGIGFTVVSFTSCVWFWRFAVRHYGSASS